MTRWGDGLGEPPPYIEPEEKGRIWPGVTWDEGDALNDIGLLYL